MGLSNTPKETVTSYQVLLDIAKAVKELPNLEQMIKLAYELPEVEAAKAQKARDTIAQYEALVAEQKTRQKDIENAENSLVDKQSKLNETLDKIAEENRKLAVRNTELLAVAEAQKETKASLEKREKELEVGLSKLQSDQEKVAAEATANAEYAAALKAKAASLKTLTESM